MDNEVLNLSKSHSTNKQPMDAPAAMGLTQQQQQFLKLNSSLHDLQALMAMGASGNNVNNLFALHQQQQQQQLKPNQTRYQQLMYVIDEMGKDIRTTYMGNKNSVERLKRGIASARILVKDCMLECERNNAKP